MAHNTPTFLRALWMAWTVVLLTACGGGSESDSATSQATSHDTSAANAETQSYLGSNRAKALATRSAAVPTLTVRARASLSSNIGPIMQVRVDDVLIGAAEVRNTVDWADFTFSAPTLHAGAKVEVVFTNDVYSATAGDRNLFVAFVSDSQSAMLPSSPTVVLDQGSGAAAFDGVNVVAGRSEMWGNGALRMSWPAAISTTVADLARRQDASRFLLQTTFGPTPALIDTLATQTYANWISTQMALPAVSSFVDAVQTRFNLGDAYRPGGAQYTPYVVSQAFWASSTSAPDQLRRRVAYALQQIFMVSQADGNLWHHSRAYANYLDLINRDAFGNFRTLMEDMALSPAMGIYLSHMRNRKEDLTTGRVPDENFAREVMQLFTIGLYELNPDGSFKLDASGRPIETYGNADVMALAKVFTGFSWAFPDNALTDSNFRWGGPNYSATADQRIDVQPMKAYPGQHSTAQKTLFEGKAWSVTLPAGASAGEDLRKALDALFNHPNVGPFIGRQLIQKLVTSNPSPAYVARVATVFNNNGKGVRGDLAAVVGAVLLDTEARGPIVAGFGKVREPVLRIAHWMRAFNAASTNGAYNFAWEISPAGQVPENAPSVFGDFRPGYIPPNSSFAARGATAPELQIVNENTVAGWVNVAESMGSDGLGWANGAREMAANYNHLAALLTAGNVNGMVEEINQLLFGSQMSASLRQALIAAMSTVGGNDAASQMNRARIAVFFALASPEYLIQR
ncbi:DUF1800 family protein [Sphaerotilus sp.]|uniref:DUF1800 family protein n=1 Tax=Sphaerotilus sp. TaxID=2093942 RepID=UPI0034E2F40F